MSSGKIVGKYQDFIRFSDNKRRTPRYNLEVPMLLAHREGLEPPTNRFRGLIKITKSEILNLLYIIYTSERYALILLNPN